MVSVRDEHGSWAGVLQLHEEGHNDSEEPQRQAEGARDRGKPCELIAISRGSQDGKIETMELDEWVHPEGPKTGDKYEFYNVLCVEWQDKIAYRKGLGRIKKDFWEASTLEWADLTLG
jgi:hypothetical protein